MEKPDSGEVTHEFDQRPHRTLLMLSLPALVSLIAEPLTGLVDTAFITRLGSESLAALGVGTTLLSASYWIFNFLGIGVQSEVAHNFGKGSNRRARDLNSLAVALGVGFGLLMLVLGWPAASSLAQMMGAEGQTQTAAQQYLQIRLLAAPAVLVMGTCFGSLRGLQKMRTPMVIALLVNLLNVVLDAALIFGYGPIPAYGIAGAAWASTISQWLGAAMALWAVGSALGWTPKLRLADVSVLMKIGGDMFLRTAFLTGFLVLGTRAATQIGPEAGAAHHVIRQVYLFSALALDAVAITAISLIGWYVGSGLIGGARRVAALTCGWSLALGVVLLAAMIIGQDAVIAAFVPADAVDVFLSAWLVSAAVQPVNALCFATDGIHWGTRDFAYLRNGMFVACGLSIPVLLLVNPSHADALTHIWWITGAWVLLRAAVGLIRVWPGIGAAPIGNRAHATTTSEHGN
jgi:multidrug resistance protein, MATE family